MKKYAVFALLVVIVALAYWQSQPGTYEDCVISGLKKVNNDAASRILAKTCREKFPDTAPKEYVNPFDQFDSPSGR